MAQNSTGTKMKVTKSGGIEGGGPEPKSFIRNAELARRSSKGNAASKKNITKPMYNK